LIQRGYNRLLKSKFLHVKPLQSQGRYVIGKLLTKDGDSDAPKGNFMGIALEEWQTMAPINKKWDKSHNDTYQIRNYQPFFTCHNILLEDLHGEIKSANSHFLFQIYELFSAF
jgi:hypothetical protein